MKSSQVWGSSPTTRWELQPNANTPQHTSDKVEIEVPKVDTESVDYYNVLRSAVLDYLDGNITKEDLEQVVNSNEED
jgi:hypothetical protein